MALAVTALPIAVAMGWLQIRDAATLPAFPVDQFLAAVMVPEGEPPPGEDADSYRESLLNLQSELSRRLEAEPGVVGLTFTLESPPPGGPRARMLSEGDWASSSAGAGLQVRSSRVALDFFQTLDVAILSGRPFQSGDRDIDAADVVIVDRAFVRRFVSDGDALGRRIRFVSGNPPAPGALGTERWHEIVGVVENLLVNPIDDDLVEPRVYRPIPEDWAGRVVLTVRVAGIEPAAMAGRLREIAAALDPTLRLNVGTLEEAFRQQRVALSLVALVVGLAVLSVLLLSAAGIYALMSFTVSQRRREIGIRTALGAQPRRLLRGIFGRALRQISLGVALGVATALLLDGLAGGELLLGQGGALLTTMVVVMSVVGLFAALGPARRGLQIEPSEVLKGE